LAGSAWDDAGDCRSGNSIPCIIEVEDVVLPKRFSSEAV